MLSNEKKKRMFENIYDIVKVCALSPEQNDEWAKLSRKHADEASRELHKFLRIKTIEWDGEANTITIGRDFKFKLVE